jgi:glycosyltransferase involved in cell wall biosynthesis
MVKLCIITHSYPRYEEDWRSNFIESLARAYARNDADVTVFVPYAVNFNRKPQDNDGVKIVSYRYMPFTSLHTVGYGHSMKSDLKISLQDTLLMPFLLLVGTLRLAALLRKEKFDMIHAHWAVPNTIIAVFGRALAFSRAKIFTSFPGSDVTVITRLGWIGKIFARIIAKSDYLSCNSSDLKEDLVKAGLDKHKIDFVIYGVNDKKIFFLEKERTALRRALEVSEKDIVLLIIGRFVPKKGFSTAFQSLKYITERKKNVKLVVVGDGPLKSEYEDILRNDHTEAYVKFIGEIPPQELSKYYSACDIFLMPSRRLPSDGLNVVVPEAMACTRPVVASNVGGNDLVIFHGVNGYLHDENDPKHLAEFVLKLSENYDIRKEMGQNSLKLIRERFNWDAIAKYYLERYSESLSIHKGRPIEKWQRQ